MAETGRARNVEKFATMIPFERGKGQSCDSMTFSSNTRDQMIKTALEPRFQNRSISLELTPWL